MPNRSELKVRVMQPSRAEAPDAAGVWCIVGLCVIGALASVDFAAYLQSFDPWPALFSPSAMVLMAP